MQARSGGRYGGAAPQQGGGGAVADMAADVGRPAHLIIPDVTLGSQSLYSSESSKGRENNSRASRCAASRDDTEQVGVVGHCLC